MTFAERKRPAHERAVALYFQKHKSLCEQAPQRIKLYENAPLVEHAHSSIAQSVEHSAVNRSVVGSSPTWGVA